MGRFRFDSKDALPWLAVAAVLVIGLLIGRYLSVPGWSKIGVIDIARVVKDSPMAKDFEKRLAERYQSLSESLKQESAGLTEEERAKREEEAYSEYIAYKQELEKRLETEIDKSIGEVAKKRGLEIVLVREGVRYGGSDITEDVIKLMANVPESKQ